MVAKTIDAGYSVRVCLTERASTSTNNTTSTNNSNNNTTTNMNINSSSNINGNNNKNDQSVHIKNISNNSDIMHQQRELFVLNRDAASRMSICTA